MFTSYFIDSTNRKIVGDLPGILAPAEGETQFVAPLSFSHCITV